MFRIKAGTVRLLIESPVATITGTPPSIVKMKVTTSVNHFLNWFDLHLHHNRFELDKYEKDISFKANFDWLS